MEEEKEFKDIENLEIELKKLVNSFRVIDQNMMALAMDYKHYMDGTFGDSDIYKLRDSLSYRLSATRLHLQILTGLLKSLDKELTQLHLESLKSKDKESHLHIHFLHREKDISSLFDSIIFHSISAFDYVGNLVSFIILGQKKLKWTSLAKSARDSKNEIGINEIGNIIDKIDRTFVGRLYDHRSYLIHISNEPKKLSYSINLNEGIVTSKISASNTFIKNFSELRGIAKTSELSLSYVLFWLLNESVDSIIEIQYALKKFMEENKKVGIPTMFLKGPNNEMLPVSSNYWCKKK